MAIRANGQIFPSVVTESKSKQHLMGGIRIREVARKYKNVSRLVHAKSLLLLFLLLLLYNNITFLTFLAVPTKFSILDDGVEEGPFLTN